MKTGMKTGVVIPFYNHAGAIGTVVNALKPFGLPCWIVDDGSDASCEPVLQDIAHCEKNWVQIVWQRPNRGKGAAVTAGLQAAAANGCTHALQIDADGQHDVDSIAKILALAARNPQAMITGYAVYDASVPKSRLYGRYITHVWVWINTLSLEIRDSMCGLRVYPLAPTLEVLRRASLGERMSFDIEILVHLFWRGVRVLNIPVPVTYPIDGVSHFQPLRDNLQISGAHARMFLGMLWRAPLLLVRRLVGKPPS